ncbi:NADPH-dependent F420 reductase [Ktedonobacter robiniae]|uniref:NADP oxidoreductase n=1 Tax=Ktedonobacter robiniae TaxID=2778365 RepID=A0ABQ3UL06_9CHLR|nr:NAD(P)-binding domain-containing protein [Ktedonobacter robiniae]GHO53378.1 NADP oxidoreductase [Ktedonobacter robiniae]
MSSLSITILGAGPIGSTLGRKWAKVGHSIAYGVQNPSSERAQALRQDLGEQIFIGSPAEALAKGDIVVLALAGQAVEGIITTYAQQLSGKIIIDAANRYPPDQKFSQTHQWPTTALYSAHILQSHAPHAKVYRAFNTYSWQNLADPDYQGIQADMFYCGPSGNAMATVEQLIAEIGLQPVRLGDLDQIDVVDSVLRLWGTLAIVQGKGVNNIAFKVLTR